MRRVFPVLAFILALSAWAQQPAAPPAAAPTSPPSAPAGTPLQGIPDSSADNQAIVPPGEIVTKVRDPFKRPAVVETASAKSELERVSLDQLELVGVMNGPKRIRALVKAPSGKTYFIHENMKLGFRSGIVTRIANDSVNVREKVVNILGEEEQVNSVLKLNMDPNRR